MNSEQSLKIRTSISAQDLMSWELIALAIIATFMAVVFVFRGFASPDSVRYGLGLYNILNYGTGQIARSFNGEISFGYYLLLAAILKIGGPAVSLSGIMNVVTSGASVILQLLLYTLFYQLTANRTASFFACLTVILAPTIWVHSHFGHPVLVALCAFIGGLIVFDRIAVTAADTNQGNKCLSLWICLTLLMALALALRSDLILAFGAFAGLLWYREAWSWKMGFRLGVACASAACLFLLARWVVLGYLVAPGGGTVADHLSSRLGLETAAGAIIKNGTLWAMAVNVLISVVAAIGLIRTSMRSRMLLLVLSWVLPWCIFLPFVGMDFGRITVPTVPIISLAAIVFIDSLATRRKALALAVTLAAAQCVSVLFYYPMVRLYAFKTTDYGRAVAAVPIGFLPTDQYHRQNVIDGAHAVADAVTQERASDVLIVGDGNVMNYVWNLRGFALPDSTGQTRKSVFCEGLEALSFFTEENTFYIADLALSPKPEELRASLQHCFGNGRAKIHIPPTKFPASTANLFSAEPPNDAENGRRPN